MTAITLVTFGCSQIDLFATKISAINDPTADNSIGNAVAANAIGVFLGLGGPWLVASLYWQFVDPRQGCIYIYQTSEVQTKVNYKLLL